MYYVCMYDIYIYREREIDMYSLLQSMTRNFKITCSMTRNKIEIIKMKIKMTVDKTSK